VNKRVAVATDKGAFVRLFFQSFVFFSRGFADCKFLQSWVSMMKMQSPKVFRKSTNLTFSSTLGL
jgi:hypothetical protein